MAVGDLVTLIGGELARRMVVVRVEGRRVFCSWRYGDRVRSDWFAASGLRVVQGEQ